MRFGSGKSKVLASQRTNIWPKADINRRDFIKPVRWDAISYDPFCCFLWSLVISYDILWSWIHSNCLGLSQREAPRQNSSWTRGRKGGWRRRPKAVRLPSYRSTLKREATEKFSTTNIREELLERGHESMNQKGEFKSCGNYDREKYLLSIIWP